MRISSARAFFCSSHFGRFRECNTVHNGERANKWRLVFSPYPAQKQYAFKVPSCSLLGVCVCSRGVLWPCDFRALAIYWRQYLHETFCGRARDNRTPCTHPAICCASVARRLSAPIGPAQPHKQYVFRSAAGVHVILFFFCFGECVYLLAEIKLLLAWNALRVIMTALSNAPTIFMLCRQKKTSNSTNCGRWWWRVVVAQWICHRL